MATPATAPSEDPKLSSESKKVASRYEDGYRVARTINGLGQLCKIVGVFVGIVMIFFAVMGSQTIMRPNPLLVGLADYRTQQNLYLISAIFFGAVVAFIGWIVGVLITGYAQHLRAALDVAVNTSPFLNEMQRVQVMRLTSPL